MNVSPKRIAWIDVARGMGIVLVVYGHVLRGLEAANLLSRTNPVWASDYTIYTFHMPLFFLLAGLQVDRSLSKGPWPFLISKLKTIAYPYLLWSWFQLLVQMLLPQDLINKPHAFSTLLMVLWWPVEQFWFLYFLFLCHMIALITGARRWLLVPLLAAGLFGTVMIFEGRLSYAQLVGTLSPWLVYYIVGILLSRPILRWQPTPNAALAWTAASAIALGVLSHLCRRLSHERPDLLTSWPATAAGVLLMISLSHLLVNRTGALAHWAGILGRASMTIYIFHILVAAGFRIALRKAHITDWLTQLVLGTLAGVGLPLLLHLWLERADLLAALGLGARRRVPLPLAVSP